MLLLNDLRLAHDAKSAGREDGTRISGAERLKSLQVLRKLEAQVLGRDLSVDRYKRSQIIFSQTRCRMVVQALPKLIDAVAANCESRRVRMAAEFLEQIATSRQPIEQMISLDTARGTVAEVAFERNDHAWSIQPFRDLRCSQSDDASMPTIAGDHRGVRLIFAMLA